MSYVELPKEFIESNSAELCKALDESPITSVRFNPRKQSEGQWNDAVKWCADGRYLSDRPIFTLDPLHAAGGYYVQEASSMAVGEICRQIIENDGLSELLAVDLCAAPGGKTTHISSVVGERGVVVANEVIRTRAGILSQNVVRWGEGNTVVCSVDSAVLGGALSGKVDILVIDAPCSGEGMFRKDMNARAEWSMAGVELCASRGRRIISDAVPMLKSGGYLIYSTCTFNRFENEGNVQWMVESGDFELCREFTAQLGNGGEWGSNFFPSEVKGEGLFVAVLRYIGEEKSLPKIKKKNTPKKFTKYSTQKLIEVEFGGKIYGYSPQMVDVVDALQNARTHILMAGVEFGEEIRGELKPSHNYALYSYAPENIFPKTEVNLEVAREFLRKGTLNADDFKEGLQRVCYGGLPLGFAKRISRRVNNMYPTTWRIVNL